MANCLGMQCPKLNQEVRVVLTRLNSPSQASLVMDRNFFEFKLEPNIDDDVEEMTFSSETGLELSTQDGFKMNEQTSNDFLDSKPLQTSGEYQLQIKLEGELSSTENDNEEFFCEPLALGQGQDKFKPKRKSESHPIDCKICKQVCSTKFNLIRHHQLKHRKFPLPTLPVRIKTSTPLKCEYCLKEFNSKGNLRIHVRIHRPEGMKMYVCHVCDKEFVHKSSFRKHKSLHSDKRNYSCSKCDFTAKYRSSICEHEKICFGFKIQDKKEATEKRKRGFPCDKCGRRFKTELGVLTHQNVRGQNCILECKQCGKIFYKINALKEHEENSHSDHFAFPCTLCPSKYKGKVALETHVRDAHRKRWGCNNIGCTADIHPSRFALKKHKVECPFPIPCTICEQIFTNKDAYSSHTHPIRCNECDKTYPRKSLMNFHIRYHDPLNPHKCESCFNGYTSKGELTTHLKMTHIKENMGLKNFTVRTSTSEIGDEIFHFTCKTCEIEFEDPSKEELLKHLVESHNGNGEKLICPTCGKGLSSEVTLLAHRNTVHGVVETEFGCDICGLYFLTLHGLEIHIAKSHYEIPLVEAAVTQLQEQTLEFEPVLAPPPLRISLSKNSCLICGKKCAGKSGLARHMTEHNMDREYKCELCTISWAHPSGLDKHNQQRHANLGLEPTKSKLSCTYCGKYFINSFGLKAHIRIHTQEKPFKCELCGKSFSNKKQRAVHYTAIHSEEKSISCDFCGEKFKRRTECSAHVKRYHKIDS